MFYSQVRQNSPLLKSLAPGLFFGFRSSWVPLSDVLLGRLFTLMSERSGHALRISLCSFAE